MSGTTASEGDNEAYGKSVPLGTSDSMATVTVEVVSDDPHLTHGSSCTCTKLSRFLHEVECGPGECSWFEVRIWAFSFFVAIACIVIAAVQLSSKSCNGAGVSELGMAPWLLVEGIVDVVSVVVVVTASLCSVCVASLAINTLLAFHLLWATYGVAEVVFLYISGDSCPESVHLFGQIIVVLEFFLFMFRAYFWLWRVWRAIWAKG